MKHSRLGHILLLLGMGLLLGQATAEITAYQNPIPPAGVGQMVTVTVSLTYNGQNSTEVVVAPSTPPGVVAIGGGQSTQLYPGVTQQISYPLTAEQSGTYWIVSDISYAEDGTWRNLRLEAPFTATGSAEPESMTPNGTGPMQTDQFNMPPNNMPPDNMPPDNMPTDNMPPNNMPPDADLPGGAAPDDSGPMPDAFNPAPDQGEQPPGGQ